jgi:hypothetical protein
MFTLGVVVVCWCVYFTDILLWGSSLPGMWTLFSENICFCLYVWGGERGKFLSCIDVVCVLLPCGYVIVFCPCLCSWKCNAFSL